MAKMIPEHPCEFNPASKEDVIFEALKRLPEEYIVFHSVGLLQVVDDSNGSGEIIERQTDFIVFHKEKGLMCIEAKAGKDIYFDGREWHYSNGDIMERHGPVNQSTTYVHALIKVLQAHRNDNVKKAIKHCKVTRAIWFPSISNAKRDTMALPLDLDRRFILTFEDCVDNPQAHIDEIFGLRFEEKNYETRLPPHEVGALLKALSPKMVISYDTFESDITEASFNRILKQQYNILEFIQDQPNAVISGTAGTGKTMIAGEKAERHAQNGEKVLFLCYNSELADDLKKRHHNDLIKIYTMDAFVKKMCEQYNEDDRVGDYKLCYEKLNSIDPQQFEYKHVIIDEGQDVCVNIHIENILTLIKTIIEIKEGSFYIFYDKLQLVQYPRSLGDKPELPRLITEADCKLTLYRNCRNTEKIAKSSSATVMKKPPLMMDPPVTGGEASIHFFDVNKDIIQNIISERIRVLTNKGIKKNDIVIITLKTIENSLLRPTEVIEKDYKKYYKACGVNFSTFRMFKGLEARAVIIVDMDEQTLNSHLGRKSYYVAASRAREYLFVFAKIDNSNCKMIDESVFDSRIRDTVVLQRKLGLSRF